MKIKFVSLLRLPKLFLFTRITKERIMFWCFFSLLSPESAVLHALLLPNLWESPDDDDDAVEASDRLTTSELIGGFVDVF